MITALANSTGIGFFHGTYWYLNYVVDLVILFGAIFGGIRGTLEFQKRRAAKKDAEEQSAIDAYVKAAVEVSITKVLTTVDDQVSKNVAEQLQEVKEQIILVAGTVEKVRAETTKNGGASMKDSQDRVEANVNRLLTGQEVQREILRNQDIKIEDISIIQQKNVDGLSDLKIAMASHIGAHVGLPEKGDRGDAGKRGDRGERG